MTEVIPNMCYINNTFKNAEWIKIQTPKYMLSTREM